MHHMFSVGLDVDTLVSKVMVTLLISIGLYAGKLDYFISPLSNRLFGKIWSLIIEPYSTKILIYFSSISENKQSAGNFYMQYLNFQSLKVFFKYFSINFNSFSPKAKKDSDKDIASMNFNTRVFTCKYSTGKYTGS